MAKRHIITLTDEEREELRTIISRGKGAARKLTRARILLKADASPGQPAWKDQQIVQALDVGIATVERVRRQFVEEGFEAMLSGRPGTRAYPCKLDGDGEAHLIALACGKAPEGRSRWTLRLLAERMVALEYVDAVSHETPGGPVLSGRGEDRVGDGQSEYAHAGFAVRGIQPDGGQTDRRQVGDSLHAQAWILAEHGGDRVGDPGSSVPGPADRRVRVVQEGGRRLGNRPQ